MIARQRPQLAVDNTRRNSVDITLPGAPLGSDAAAQPIIHDDGSADVYLGGLGGAQAEPLPPIEGLEHSANLVEHVDESTLQTMVSDAIEGFEADDQSNEEWRRLAEEGMRLLGFRAEPKDYPFRGAASMFHPVMADAVMRGQANARGELLPAEGPVKTRIFGAVTPDIEERADRAKNWMNYYLTEVDEDYYPAFDQMLFYVYLLGNAYKQVYMDPLEGRPVSPFILPDQFVVSYNTTSLAKAGRFTKVVPMLHSELVRLQLAGYYRKVDLQRPNEDPSSIQTTRDRIEGRSADYVDGDERHTILEIHLEYDLPQRSFEHVDEQGRATGLPLPWILTVDKDSRTALRLARGWKRDDAKFKRHHRFIKFGLLPALGFLDAGYAHILGGIAKGSTALLRQLVDAGTLSIFPGGLRVKGARADDNLLAIGPCEFREIDTLGMPIRDAVMPLPYKEPSQVLLELLQTLTMAGQRLAGSADLPVGEGRQDAPVGTTVAMLEQGLKIMSAVHKRLHVSQHRELQHFAELFAEDPTAKYPYSINGQTGVAVASDFMVTDPKSGQRVIEFTPVSDPNVPTQVQRLALAQARLSLAMQRPDIHDARTAFQQVYATMGMSQIEIDAVLPPPQQAQPLDPVSEFQAVMSGKPIKAFVGQNHAAHLAAHIAQTNIPGVNTTPPGQSLMAHIAEHVGLEYRQEIEAQTGQPLPPPGQPLPPQVEAQISQRVASVSKQVLHNMLMTAAQMGMGDQQGDQGTALIEAESKRQELMVKQEESRRKAEQTRATNLTELARQKLQHEDAEADRMSRDYQAYLKFLTEREQGRNTIAQEGLRTAASLHQDVHRTHQEEISAEAAKVKAEADHHAAHADIHSATKGVETARLGIAQAREHTKAAKARPKPTSKSKG